MNRLYGEVRITISDRVITGTAIILNLAATVWWIGQGVQYAAIMRKAIPPSPAPLHNAVLLGLFAVPALLAILTLLWMPHRAARGAAIALNVIAATWWVRMYLRVKISLPWAVFPLPPLVAVIALFWVSYKPPRSVGPAADWSAIPR
jgi:hypothetical protein